jgi:hypothetical protein
MEHKLTLTDVADEALRKLILARWLNSTRAKQAQAMAGRW